MTATQQPSVTQADRNIASDYFYQTGDYPRSKAARDGTYDLSICVQMFTRHREASTIDLRAQLAEAKKQSEFRSRQWSHYEKLAKEFSSRDHMARGDLQKAEAENKRLREALTEAIEVLDSLNDDEIAEELLPRLRAAQSTQTSAGCGE